MIDLHLLIPKVHHLSHKWAECARRGAIDHFLFYKMGGKLQQMLYYKCLPLSAGVQERLPDQLKFMTLFFEPN